MTKIIIIGAGFAGVWSALAARKYFEEHEGKQVSVAIVAPEPKLVMRPRLYEKDPARLVYELNNLLEDNSIEFIPGVVHVIRDDLQQIELSNGDQYHYDRLILAAGSTIDIPDNIPGLAEHAFNVDSIEAACKLEEHLHQLSSVPRGEARDTIVVCGAGFTGIELATELPGRTKALGVDARILLLDRSNEIGQTLGDKPRSVINEAIRHAGIQVRLGSDVQNVSSDGVMLGDGTRIRTLTTIWTAGPKASPLTQQISGDKDSFGRLYTDSELRVIGSRNIFAAGDTAHVDTDDLGHVALMSCQHALILGRFAGYNAAADLYNGATVAYKQPAYNCCLDLGDKGALLGVGWTREVARTGPGAKRLKRFINEVLIYPPSNSAEALAQASIQQPDADALLEMMLAAAA